MTSQLVLLILWLFTCCLAVDSTDPTSGSCPHLWTSAWQSISHGVDITKLDFNPILDTLHRKNGIRETVFDFTCFNRHLFSLFDANWTESSNHTIRSKNGGAHLLYSLPDDLKIDWQHRLEPIWHHDANQPNSIKHDLVDESSIFLNQSNSTNASLQAEIRTFESDEYAFARQQLIRLQLIGNRWQSSWWADAGFAQTSDFTGAFKLTQKFKRMRWQRLVNARIGHEARVHVPAYRVQLPDIPNLPLSRRLRNAIDRLNASESTDSNEYEQIIHLFGTHFLHRIDFGGLARVAFRKLESADGIDLEKLDVMDGFDYQSSFDFEVRSDRLQSEQNFAVEIDYFKSNRIVYEKTITFYGGRVTGGRYPLSSWADSVPLNPWILGGIAIPISELFEDPTKQLLMQKAIVSYLDKAELLSMKETLKSMQQLSIWNERLEAQQKQVDRFNENPSVTHDLVLATSQTVHDLIEHELLLHYRNHTFITLHHDLTYANSLNRNNATSFISISLILFAFLSVLFHWFIRFINF